jgi:hypothetical protein
MNKRLLQYLVPAFLLFARAFASHDGESAATANFGTQEQVNSYLKPDLWLGGVLQASVEEEMLLQDASSNGHFKNDKHHRDLLDAGDGNCEILRLYIRKSDIQQSALVIPNGYSFQIPFFEVGTNRRIGVWYEQLTYANQQQNMGSGMVTLKFNVNTSLAMSIVAGQRQLAILGGTGFIGFCPSGFGIVSGDTADKVQFDFKVCDSCSPF